MNMPRIGFVLVLLLTAGGALGAQPPAAAIASASPHATAAGFEVLEAGGNAFDAAIAVSAALAVAEPFSSGLGGGGFWLLHRAADGHEVMLDGRERAPLAAERNMYLDADGKLTSDSLEGPLSAGIPGLPAALGHLAANYGRLPLARSLAPAIRLARDGFLVTPHYRRMAELRLPLLRRYASTSEIFLHNGEVPAIGARIRQPDLARTLEKLADTGTAVFYRGPLAEMMAASVRAAGGIWSREDLTAYEVKERAPISGRFCGARIVSASPPSSGGVALMTMLNLLAGYDLSGQSEATRTHLIVEAMRRAYRDRAEHLGDPDHWQVPVAELLSTDHISRLGADIRLDLATPSDKLTPATPPAGRGQDTSHFSILDREGNRVAATLSINYPFGSGFVVPGTGVLLNDEMDDFSSSPGTPNAYGLVGAEANAIAGGKRPLSSMTPTFIETQDRLAILGTPGGSRIITMVLLASLDFLGGGNADTMVKRPRFHHQYLPDLLTHEPGTFGEATSRSVAFAGHDLKEISPYGNMQVVVWDMAADMVTAASDPRGEGSAVVK